MPVRSRKKLLAGVAALLGLSIASLGCHSNLVDQMRTPPFVPPAPPGGVAMAVPVASPVLQQVSMPGELPVVTTTGAPAVAIAPPVATPPAARIHRPKRGIFSTQMPASLEPSLAAAPAPALSAPPRSAAIQRVSTGMPLGAMDRPHVVGYIPSAMRGEPGELSLPRPMPAGKEGDPIVARRAAPPPAKEKDLPMPTKKAMGYPDLPGPAITHPVEAPREFAKRAFSAYVVEPPDVLAIELAPTLNEGAMPIAGPHLVRPDGTVGLGAIGSVFVAGMTLVDAKEQILQAIFSRRRTEKGKDGKEPPTIDDFRAALKVDVQAYNSKFYYVVTDGGGYGAQVISVPCTGNETVLDAISRIQGLPAVASQKKIWLARATPAGHAPNILPVDFHGIVMAGSAATNFQLYPGDRLFVHSDPRIRVDSHFAKILAPIERLLGVTLLGSGVVNSIKNGNNNNGNAGFR